MFSNILKYAPNSGFREVTALTLQDPPNDGPVVDGFGLHGDGSGSDSDLAFRSTLASNCLVMSDLVPRSENEVDVIPSLVRNGGARRHVHA